MLTVPVIIAGGIGERFWPLSRTTAPKQLLALVSSRTMIEETLLRCYPLCKKEAKPLIMTGRVIADRMKKILPHNLTYDCLIEPEGKNTAPATLMAAAWIERKYGPAVMVILSADHDIRPRNAFLKSVRTAIRFARSNEALVTFGVRPTRPECGYGYLNTGETVMSDRYAEVCRVKRFIEKPSRTRALNLVKSQSYLWNCGMFVWKTSTIIEEFETLMPDLADLVKEAKREGFSQKSIDRFYHKSQKISIDYGIMERSDKVYVVRGNFMWDDIGSWEAISRIYGGNADGVTMVGDNIIEFECNDSILFNKSSTSLAAIGLNDIAVINTDDALLVTHRSKLPDLKKYLTSIKESKRFPREIF